MVQTYSFSQFSLKPTVSVVEEFNFQTVPHHLQFLHYSGSKIRDVVFHDVHSAHLIVAVNQQDGTFLERKIVDTILTVSSLTVGNINDDGIDDIVVVQREFNRIITYLSDRRDSSYKKYIFPVAYYPEQVLIADISGDRIPDIIVVGKLSSGVTVLRGRGNNRFSEPLTLFADISVSTIAVIRLNGDHIPDVVVHNWLSNEDIFYFGLGNLQFSEQSAFSYGSDSTITLFSDVDGDGITDVIVASQQYQSFLVYHSNGLGNFFRQQSLSLLRPPTMLTLAQFSRSNVPDIMSFNMQASQLSLLLNKGDGTFYDEIVFGMPYQRSTLFSEDINGDGFADIILFDANSSRYTVFWNERTRSVRSGGMSTRFAVGNNPNSLFVADLNGDGCDDIFVSNESSSTISVLYGSRTTLSSQISIETPDQPTSVSLYAKSDSSVTLITSHSRDAKIGVMTISSVKDSTLSLMGDIESYTISLQGKPLYVLPDISARNTPISLYAFLKSPANPIVFYQQLRGTQFIAKSLTPLIPSRILFATISDFNSDGYTDLAYIYSDKQVNKDNIGITLNDARGEFSGATYTLTLPDTGNRRSFLFVEDLNLDQQKDYLYYNSVAKTFSVLQGKQNGNFGLIVQIADDVTVSSYDVVQFYDYDVDGVLDILYFDSSTKMLTLLRNRGNGTFYKKQPLFELPAETQFRCGDFNGDGKPDVAFLSPLQQTINIRYGKDR
jgi:hypothetical protein